MLSRKVLSLTAAVRAPVGRAMCTQKKPTAASVYALSGLDEGIYKNRKVTIFRPSKSAMSSGKCHMNTWKILFDPQAKWSNPLMGWTSSADTMGTQLMENLTFPSAETAAAFCGKYGIEYEIQQPEESEVIWKAPKMYADNFQWDGDEEDGNTGEGYWATRRSGTK